MKAGKATPVPETALKRREGKGRVCALSIVPNLLNIETKRWSFLNVCNGKGPGRFSFLHMLSRIQVLQVKRSPRSQPGKRVTGVALPRSGCSSGKAGSQLLPRCCLWREREQGKQEHICPSMGCADTARAQKTDPSNLVLLFHFWSGASLVQSFRTSFFQPK